MTDSLFVGLGYLGAGLGAGLCAIGVGIGIGNVGNAALEGSARQPESIGELQKLMLIPAALIEGVGLFGLVLCFLLINKSPSLQENPSQTTATATEGHVK